MDHQVCIVGSLYSMCTLREQLLYTLVISHIIHLQHFLIHYDFVFVDMDMALFLFVLRLCIRFVLELPSRLLDCLGLSDFSNSWAFFS